MGVGIVDEKLKELRDPNWDHPHLIFLHGWDGSLWGDGKGKIKNEGQGYGLNNTVEMDVDLERGIIEWNLNGSLKIHYEM